MRRLITAAATAAALALLGACASSTGSTASPAGQAATSSPPSCRAQFESWKSGPARTAAKGLATQLRAVQAASKAQDVPQLVAALKRAGRAAAATAKYPMPHCADPHGYWQALLTRIRAAGDNAGTGNGLGAILLAMAPLKQAPALERKLGAELKQTVHAKTVFK
jgi:hypothetical protein